MNDLVIDAMEWFTSGSGCVGIVLVRTDFGHKAYIGVGAGNNERDDARHIANLGARFRYGAAIWPWVQEWAE